MAELIKFTPINPDDQMISFINEDHPLDQIHLIWKDVSYSIVKKKQVKKILEPQSGYIKSGSLTTLMGPSGAGKSTLLNCITGRYHGSRVRGEIIVSKSRRRQTSIGYVPQDDNLFPVFTARETLIFASKMKNHLPKGQTDILIDATIKSLELESCADVRIGRCSGGEVKRICIGLELLSKPDILVLDEPTTGLDSVSAHLVTQVLKKLTEKNLNPPAIIATIHQPNYKILTMFDNLYLLTRVGQLIYAGPPDQLVKYFHHFNMICPEYRNPADFALDIASGDDMNILKQMEQKTRQENEVHGIKSIGQTSISIQKLVQDSVTHSSIKKTIHLLLREWTCQRRNAFLTIAKILVFILNGLLVPSLWKDPIGGENGCWNMETNITSFTSVSQLMSGENSLVKKFENLTDNFMMIFIIFVLVTVLNTVSSYFYYRIESKVVLREINNRWYNKFQYFLVQSLWELPLTVFNSLVFSLLIYTITGQKASLWRFGFFWFSLFLTAEISQTFGYCIGVVFVDDIVSAGMNGLGITFVFFFLSGIIVRIGSMSLILRLLSLTSFLRYSIESMIIALYGFDRCSEAKSSFLDEFFKLFDPVKKIKSLISGSSLDPRTVSSIIGSDEVCTTQVFNRTINFIQTTFTSTKEEVFHFPDKSFVLSGFDLKDETLATNMISLIIYSLIFKLFMYLLLVYKTRSNK